MRNLDELMIFPVKLSFFLVFLFSYIKIKPWWGLICERFLLTTKPHHCLPLMFLFYRAAIFPFLLKGGKPTPFIPFVLALVFCIYNGYMQSHQLLFLTSFQTSWLTSIQTVTGAFHFNNHSNGIMKLHIKCMSHALSMRINLTYVLKCLHNNVTSKCFD